ncbi:MAG: HDOD domain-containing protein [Terriglobia bacterium]
MKTSAHTVPFSSSGKPPAGFDCDAERLLAPWCILHPQVAKLSEVLRSEPLDLKILSEAARATPELAERVVKLSNASLFGLPQPVSTIAQAAMGVRSDVLRTLLLTCHLVERIAQNLPPSAARFFWRHALLVAAFSQHISQWMRNPEPDLAYFAGLLHDIGWLPLLAEGGAAAAGASDASNQEFAASLGCHEHQSESGHCALGASLGRRWGFPESLVEIFEFHHEPAQALNFPKLASTVAVADACARIQLSGNTAGSFRSSTEAVLHGLDPRIRFRLAEIFEVEFQRIENWLNCDSARCS